jgi:periplasmic divalent cation tolerance protein
MSKELQPLIVLTTLSDEAAATVFAEELVGSRLAACVNILPNIKSVYFWNGELCREAEVKLFIKTNSARRDELIQFMKAKHPYATPEITVIGGARHLEMDATYESWLNDFLAGR